MNREIVVALAALVFVIGGWSGAEAAFLPYQDYFGATIETYDGPLLSNTESLAAGTSQNFSVSVFNQLIFQLFNVNSGTSICATGFGCVYGSELDPSRNYLVDILDGKGGPSLSNVTLSAGLGPIVFAEQVASAPLPSSLPMFAVALLGLGASAWRKHVKMRHSVGTCG